MKKTILLVAAALTAALSGVRAQQPTLSPLPQKATWSEVAFAHGTPVYIEGADKADADAVALLCEKLDGCLTPSPQGAVRLLIGEVGDKAVKAYRKQVPAHAEGYLLSVEPGRVVIAGRDGAGTYYGVQTFLRLWRQQNVMQCRIEDWPSVDCRGVIEGFYGNPWSHKDRLRQFEFYGCNKLNIYVYGPKDDPYHRAHWRDPYPQDEAERLKELVQEAHRNKVQFVWAVHPGGDIQWNLKDSMAVCQKLEWMYELGVRTFAVFFDDIWGEGSKADKQAGLLNYVTDNFVRKHSDVQPLIMCPTQYNKAWSGGDYLSTLGTRMYPEVRVMWTGNSVVDMIERDDMEWINKQLGRKAFIWLNYPVNDYCQSRMLMGKTYGNGLDINEMVSGFCSNPMEYAEASKVSLYSIADYTWNMPQYDAVRSWQQAITELMPTASEPFRWFCENNIDLGKTGHGLRREGESPRFPQAGKAAWTEYEVFFQKLAGEAALLLADSVNSPEMLGEIKPWAESMRLQGLRGLTVTRLAKAQEAGDSIQFIGLYRTQQAIEQAQKAIISRNWEGSVVKAKPVVGGTVIAPWIDRTLAENVKAYKRHHTYGREVFPAQAVEDGQYTILADGRYLTDAQASTDRTGDHPVLQASRDSINPQRQQWNVELDITTGRYKISNVQDSRYVNERGAFWADKSLNPFDPEWHTFILTRQDDGTYTIQCGGRAGKGFWKIEGDRIVNAPEGTRFRLEPVR